MIQTLGLSPPEKRNISSPVLNPGFWEVFGGGNGSDAGELVSDSTAMQISTVYACVKILSESVASLPLKLYRIAPQGKVQDTANPLHYLLSVAPNDEQTSFGLIETLVAHLTLSGNAYAQIERSGDGTPIALWNLQPRLTEPYRLPSGLLAYKTADGESLGKSRIIAAKDIIHVALTAWDGVTGLSPIMQAKRSLGLNIAAEKYGSQFFTNSATPSGILTTQKTVKPEDKTKMRQAWEESQSGRNKHRVAVLDQELKFQQISVTNAEAQFLELRQFSRSEIAALFRIPPHMVGDLSKLTNANSEQLNLQFVSEVLRPLVGRIEAELTKKLLPREPGKVSDLQLAFDLTERTRGDTAAQTAAATAGRVGGWLSANDVRRSLGLNEAGPELDVYLYQINTANAERLLDAPAPQKEPVPQ